RNRDRAGTALRSIAQRRPIGGRFCDITAATGHHRDRFARRFRSPDAVRCRCPGAARHGTCSGLRFLVSPFPCLIFALRRRLNPLRNQKCGPFAPREEFRRRLLAGWFRPAYVQNKVSRDSLRVKRRSVNNHVQPWLWAGRTKNDWIAWDAWGEGICRGRGFGPSISM